MPYTFDDIKPKFRGLCAINPKLEPGSRAALIELENGLTVSIQQQLGEYGGYADGPSEKNPEGTFEVAISNDEHTCVQRFLAAATKNPEAGSIIGCQTHQQVVNIVNNAAAIDMNLIYA